MASASVRFHASVGTACFSSNLVRESRCSRPLLVNAIKVKDHFQGYGGLQRSSTRHGSTSKESGCSLMPIGGGAWRQETSGSCYPEWGRKVGGGIFGTGHMLRGFLGEQTGRRRENSTLVGLYPGPASSPEISAGMKMTVTPESLWEELKPCISYLNVQQLRTVRRALQLAFKAHDGQTRKSGEPYIIHPVEVSRILGDLEMDWETIVAGLLHDTVEDTTVVTFEQIDEEYGPDVRRIVEGETKVSKLGKMTCQPDVVSRDVKADDLLQMFLAMTEEVRVIIVKLADRLHNMRTLSHMLPHKQKYIATETLQVFAPLARLLGMYRIKSELEDLSFMYAQPQEYSELKRRIDMLCKEQEETVLEAKSLLEKAIASSSMDALHFEVKALCKEPYSIHKKVLQSKGTIDEVQDIAQLRIILRMDPSAADRGITSTQRSLQQVCYHVLGIIHSMWPPVPHGMKDYIATPKPNGYQSLHTTVLPLGSKVLFPLEIQIRTEEMDKLAEWGIAAHHSGRAVNGNTHPEGILDVCNMGGFGENPLAWALFNDSKDIPPPSRGLSSCLNDADIARRVSWLNSIREWQEEFVGSMSSREIVDTITADLFGSRVFVFTPQGEMKNLPKGATVVDYAYLIHTDLGNKMVAAKVNGNFVSPIHPLSNADLVQILSYDGVSTKKQFLSHQKWLQHAKTRSARHKITKFLKDQAALKAEEITEDYIRDFLRDWGESGSDSEDIAHPKSTLESPSSVSPSSTVELTDQAPSNNHRGVKGPLSISKPAGEEEARQFFEDDRPSRSTAAGPSPHSSSGASTQNGRPHDLAHIPEQLPAQQQLPKVNGTPSQPASDLLTFKDWDPGSGIMNKALTKADRERMRVDDPAVQAIVAGFDKWQRQQVSRWQQDSTGKTVQWLGVVVLDRTGLLADVSAILTQKGLLISSHAGQTKKPMQIGIMLFEVEGFNRDTVMIGHLLEAVDGVLSYALGCTFKSTLGTSFQEDL